MKGVSDKPRPKVSLVQLFPNLDAWRGYICDCDRVSRYWNPDNGLCRTCGLKYELRPEPFIDSNEAE